MTDNHRDTSLDDNLDYLNLNKNDSKIINPYYFYPNQNIYRTNDNILVITFNNIRNYKDFIYNTYISLEELNYLTNNLILLTFEQNSYIRNKIQLINNNLISYIRYNEKIKLINKLNIEILDYPNNILCLYNMDISLLYNSSNITFNLSIERIYDCFYVNSKIDKSFLITKFLKIIKNNFQKSNRRINDEGFKKIDLQKIKNRLINHSILNPGEMYNGYFFSMINYFEDNNAPKDYHNTIIYILNKIIDILSVKQIKTLISNLLIDPSQGLSIILRNEILLNHYLSNKDNFINNDHDNTDLNFYHDHSIRSNELIYIYNKTKHSKKSINLLSVLELISMTNLDSFSSISDTNIVYPNKNIFNDINAFKEKLNHFISKNKEFNLLNNILFDNVTICGSCMPACIDSSLSYEDIDNLYSDSDLDIMINSTDNINFITKALEIIKIINNNINCYLNSQNNINFIEYEVKRSINIYFTSDIADNKNIDKQLILNIFKEEIEDNKKIDIHLSNIYDEYQTFKTDTVNKVDIKYKFNIKMTQNKDILKLYPFVINIKNIDIFSFTSLTNSVAKEITINTTTSLHNDLKDLIDKQINDFHLSCVRSYYTGSDVFLLPSCIITMMIKTNIDISYKIKKNIYDVIIKYGIRGYDTILNKNEYCECLNIVDKDKIHDFFNYITLV
jgi:hypothetical protein